MGLESGSFISALVSTNPVGATDPKSQGDDHLRFIKAKLLETFPNVTGAVTSTHTELNLVAGATGGLATLSVSFAAALASISAINTLVSSMGTLSASVTSSDITGSIRTPVLQTQAGYTAGTFTAATVTVNNKGIITKISAGGALGSTITAGNTITLNPFANSNTTTAAHGLGVKPMWYQVYLECLTAELGYTTGLIVECGTTGPVEPTAIPSWSIRADATNVIIATNSGTRRPMVPHVTTSTMTEITAANWKVVVIPYKFA